MSAYGSGCIAAYRQTCRVSRTSASDRRPPRQVHMFGPARLAPDRRGPRSPGAWLSRPRRSPCRWRDTCRTCVTRSSGSPRWSHSSARLPVPTSARWWVRRHESLPARSTPPNAPLLTSVSTAGRPAQASGQGPELHEIAHDPVRFVPFTATCPPAAPRAGQVPAGQHPPLAGAHRALRQMTAASVNTSRSQRARPPCPPH